MDPLKLSIMNVDAHILEDGLQEVTSAFIKESSTNNFDQDGLFSERIFGEVASPDRIKREGYIVLNTDILAPKMYDIVTKLKSFYGQIMNGTAYAIFDEKEGDFIAASESDDAADTGYSFFMEHVFDLKPKHTGAVRRDTKVNLFYQEIDCLTINKWIVIPAGLREYSDKNGRGEYDDINKLYMSLINLARPLSSKSSNSKIFDTAHVALQKKVNEIYEYIANIIGGKKGFLQSKYGARAIALGTRNVITATNMTVSSSHANELLKSDEVLIPLFQAVNMYKPLVIHALKTIFFNHVFSYDSNQASLIDKDTLTLNYTTVSAQQKAKYLTSTKIEDLFNNFRDDANKHKAVTIKDTDNKEYYMYMMYNDGKTVHMCRNVEDLKRLKGIDDIDAHIRPLTYFEMFYIAISTLLPKIAQVTRYPVSGADTVFIGKVHIATTVSYDDIMFSMAHDPMFGMKLPRFPIKGESAIDAMGLHPSKLKSLGADHDGDQVTANGLLSEEATAEGLEYLDNISSITSIDGSMSVGISTDLAELALFNITRDLAE